MTSDNAIPIATTGDVTRLYFADRQAFGAPHARPALSAATMDRAWDDEQLLAAAHAGAAGRDLHGDVLTALCARYVDLVQADSVRELEFQSAAVRAREAEQRHAAACRLADVRAQQLATAQGVAAALEQRLAEMQLELTGCQLALDEERNAHQVTMFARELAEERYAAELAERNRVAALHAAASAQAAMARRQLAQLGVENLHLRHELAGTTPVSVAIALATDERFDQSDPDADDTLVMDLEDFHQAGMEVGCE